MLVFQGGNSWIVGIFIPQKNHGQPGQRPDPHRFRSLSPAVKNFPPTLVPNRLKEEKIGVSTNFLRDVNSRQGFFKKKLRGVDDFNYKPLKINIDNWKNLKSSFQDDLIHLTKRSDVQKNLQNWVYIWMFPQMVVPPFHTPKWSFLVGKPTGLLGKPTILGTPHMLSSWPLNFEGVSSMCWRCPGQTWGQCCYDPEKFLFSHHVVPWKIWDYFGGDNFCFFEFGTRWNEKKRQISVRWKFWGMFWVVFLVTFCWLLTQVFNWQEAGWSLTK